MEEHSPSFVALAKEAKSHIEGTDNLYRKK